MRCFLLATLTLTAAAQTPPPTPESTPHTFTGTLFDVARHDCGTEVKTVMAAGTCPISINTKEFGISQVDGKFIRFDEGGNQKAIDALRASKKGSALVISYWRTGKSTGPVTATVVGTLTSDTLNVNNIKID